MAQPLRQLPRELEENILSRLPPQSLVRFRAVCKSWRNCLFNDNSFLNEHFSRSRPGFLFLGSPKNYSIDIINPNSIDPTIKLSELPSSAVPYQDLHYRCTTIKACDEFLLYNNQYLNSFSALWNPWMSQFKLIEKDGTQFRCCGLGYEITTGRTNKVYKVLGFFDCVSWEENAGVAIYECASHVFKHIDLPQNNWLMFEAKENVSLNGNLYWLSHEAETTNDEYFIRSFDFSVGTFKPFCLLPCQKDNDYRDELILQVFKEDRFSLLKQNYVTRKMEIWVTKKIDREEVVVWTKMMNLPTTTFPRLFEQFYGKSKSYFICDETLFVCCSGNTTTFPCIYIVREDLCKQIPIDSGIYECCHCVYIPSLFPVP